MKKSVNLNGCQYLSGVNLPTFWDAKFNGSTVFDINKYQVHTAAGLPTITKYHALFQPHLVWPVPEADPTWTLVYIKERAYAMTCAMNIVQSSL